MNTIRIVNEGAIPWPYDMPTAPDGHRHAYAVENTTGIESPWPAKQAAVLLGLSLEELDDIYDEFESYKEEWLTKGLWYDEDSETMPLSQYLGLLITLELDRIEKGLSNKDYSKQMEVLK